MSLNSHRSQLIATAVAASVATAGVVWSWNALSKQRKRRQLDQDIRRAIATQGEEHASPDVLLHSAAEDVELTKVAVEDFQYDEELLREQLARNYAFFGDEGMQKIRGSSVVVVGCGGVGSWAAVMLVRSGVSKIRLVDFDYVTLSSLNRHATAGLSDVGTPKVKCVERTLKSIAKWANIDACVDIWRKEDGGDLLEGYDWVVDAIDNIQTKVDLLKYCHDNSIKVFSSMGAGAKCDPTRIQISDISHTIYDPLARSVRRRLRLLGVSSGIPVVYSTEVPGDVKLLPLPEEEFQKGPVKELNAFDDFRVRILPVLGPLPAIFGLNAASYILCEMAGKPINNPLPIKNRKKLYERMYRDLLRREEKLAGEPLTRLPIDEDDVALVFEDLYRGRSAIPPHEVPARPTLVRWDYTKPLSVENCIVLDHKDAEKHFEACSGLAAERKQGVDLWGAETEEVVKRRAEEARKAMAWVM
ncbi:ubiquitin-protein ligase molybdopterin-converting factor [Ephemerocybe angulata]|uniref:Ubiquitin-protein ligase molybdopterin-converting factor n=1 Tax=Ephemerocybe angulata TaxID=980116 RepID=A0A8H6HS37_9AGAR|nr:ubiquitin-protein ligase molybdopterin-converting factor [Tulosesus angulatus]